MAIPKVLAIIPARGGSKSIPGKNIMPAGGKPLLVWTIEAAHHSRHITRTILSSDDDQIMSVASAYQCEVPFKRPSDLATDTARSVDVVLHALNQLPGFDYVMLLQPTSPLRTTEDIDLAFEAMVSAGAPSCVSLTASAESPFWMMTIDGSGRISPLMGHPFFSQRRQDLPMAYVVNGAIYIAQTDWFVKNKGFIGMETTGYLMPSDRSIDIDTPSDFDQFLSSLRDKTTLPASS
jgi:CMP-N-acetylneuraminic acid synthetase